MISLNGRSQRQTDGLDLHLTAEEVALLSEALARAAARVETYVRCYPHGRNAGLYEKQAVRMRELRTRLHKRGGAA